jgi:hypothetical protein
MATLEDAKRIAKQLGTTISPERLLVGMKVEMKNVDPRINVTDDDLAKIALAHFKENPGSIGFGDYYHQLEEMEKRSDTYWKRHSKPEIYDVKLFDVAAIRGWF